MNQQAFADELDRAVGKLLVGRTTPGDPELESFLAVAQDLAQLPDPEFKARLKSDLLEEAQPAYPLFGNQAPAFEQVQGAAMLAEMLPTLGGRHFGVFPTDHRSFLVSFASHAALVLLIASGIWVTARPIIQKPVMNSDMVVTYDGRGGGGSGDHSSMRASKGTPPKFSDHQLTPPAIVVRNPDARLQVPPTVLGPPDVKLPQSNQVGDLVSSNIVMPSNGTGSRGGAGDGTGLGLGNGDGDGVGPGSDRAIGGERFSLRGAVTAPRAIYDPEPEYSDEARKARQQGRVVLSLVVDPQGHARDIHIARSLGMGLDEKAIEAVKKWRFEPGSRAGHPIAVQVNVEVNFRLY